MNLSQLILCHFGQELHDQHVTFNRSFGTLLNNSIETGYFIEKSLPLRELFLQDYSALEKVLVLINIALFSVSLSSDTVDQEVSTAITYIMFAIAYFITTSSCLFGANALKRKVSQHDTRAKQAELTIATNLDNCAPTTNKSKVQSRKQQLSGNKRGKTTAAQPTVMKTRQQRRNFVSRALDCLVTLMRSFESFASRLLRVCFFILNLVMLWLCVINLD